MGCRKEDLEGLEAQLEEVENQPSADNLMAQERELRARLATTECEIAEQSDRLNDIQSSLPEAEVSFGQSRTTYVYLGILGKQLDEVE